MALPERPSAPQSKSAWLAYALVAAALAILVVMLVPHNDVTPNPDTTNTGPSMVQPVQPTPQPSAP
jgi:hypothetical protein